MLIFVFGYFRNYDNWSNKCSVAWYHITILHLCGYTIYEDGRNSLFRDIDEKNNVAWSCHKSKRRCLCCMYFFLNTFIRCEVKTVRQSIVFNSNFDEVRRVSDSSFFDDKNNFWCNSWCVFRVVYLQIIVKISFI